MGAPLLLTYDPPAPVELAAPIVLAGPERRTSGMTGITRPDDTGRPDSDFYATPSHATKALLAREFLGPRVWEPSAGTNAIVDVLRAADIPVIGTDLHAYGDDPGGRDFLLERELLAPVIVTNPPFKHAAPFARHALDLGADKVCLFLRLAFLEGSRRVDLWPRLARVHVFSKRVTLWRGGHEREGEASGGMMDFAWFVWEREHRGATTLGWINDNQRKDS